MPPRYADLADLPEDDRIELIAQAVREGQVVGFFVDAKPKRKAERYLRKLRAKVPALLVDHQGPGTPGSTFIRVRLKPN